MKRNSLSLLYVSLLGVFVFVSGFFVPFEKVEERMNAAIFFVESVSIADLRHVFFEAGTREGTRPIKILIVPGHDKINSGTSFRGMTEESLNVKLGEELFSFLMQNPKFDPVLVRNDKGYLPEFEEYLNTNKDEVHEFIREHAQVMNALIKSGQLEGHQPGKGVTHNKAPDRVVDILFGVNKWASEKEFDMILHIHFNDYAGRNLDTLGKHSGFTIYVPEHQYSNARASTAIARSVMSRLEKFQSLSTAPKEGSGIVESQDLIAIGAKNTVDGAALLIEYGYVYEPEFTDPAIQSLTLQNFAFQTYAGILDFFSDPLPIGMTPFFTPVDVGLAEKATKTEVFLLQTELRRLGFFPPNEKSLKDCPIAGVFGPCTKEALKDYIESQKLVTN